MKAAAGAADRSDTEVEGAPAVDPTTDGDAAGADDAGADDAGADDAGTDDAGTDLAGTDDADAAALAEDHEVAGAVEPVGEQPFLRIAEVLATTPGVVQGSDGPIHVWPRVSTGAPEDTTEAAWSEVTWIEDLAAAKVQGDGYLDWRAVVAEDGQWRYFLRGD